MGASAAIAGAVIAAAGTTYTVSENEKAKDKAEEEKKKQEAAQSKLEQDAKDKVKAKQSEDAGNAARDIAIRRAALSKDKGAGGRAGTILTSPLGLPGATAGGGTKTALGS